MIYTNIWVIRYGDVETKTTPNHGADMTKNNTAGKSVTVFFSEKDLETLEFIKHSARMQDRSLSKTMVRLLAAAVFCTQSDYNIHGEIDYATLKAKDLGEPYFDWSKI